jgi:hypothetical protein
MINIRQNKGFALIFSLIFLFLIISFMGVYILAVANGINQANRTANLKKAYYVADAGLADAYERISQAGITIFTASTCTKPNIPSTCTPATLFIPSGTTDNGTYSVGNVNGSYIVSLGVTTSPLTYTITSTGTYGGASRTLQLIMVWATISKYAYWSNTEINPTLGTLWWISGMLTTGPIQTNGQFNIMGNPVFNGPVTESNLPMVNGVLGTTTTSTSPNYYYGTGTNPNSTTTSDPSYIFPDGITNDAPAIDLPPPATLSAIKTSATNGGLVLTGTSTIIFNSTGTITVTGKVVNTSNCTTTTTYHNTTIPKPANQDIYVQSSNTIPACTQSGQDGNVTVQGTVSGPLTVAADQNIYISGNVQYNQDPRPTTSNPAGYPNSPDMLGLVANNNITVIEADAPAQLEVAGVLVALQGSFDVDQYSINPDPIHGGDGAVMDQFGSLINNYSGCTGVVNGSGQLTSGWNQIQSYDARLANLSPPGLPKVYTEISIKECVNGACG